MIETERLTKRYGHLLAVDELSFTVGQGEVLGFLGPNGAGKSTTMKMLSGFLSPTSGSARICGYDVETQSVAAKRRIGYLPEGAPSYGEMTPRTFLDFIADIRDLRDKRKAERLDEVILFHRLSRADMSHIVEIQLRHLEKLLVQLRQIPGVLEASRK